MKVSFVLNWGIYSKTGKWGLSRKHDNDSNSGYVRKWKTCHCLETIKGFNIKGNPLINLIKENSFKLGINVLVILNKLLVIVFTICFTLDMDWDPKTQSSNLCPFLTHSVRNGPSVSFGANVPCCFQWTALISID